MEAAQPWASFSHDPRLPEHAGLRASDADREVVHAVLAEAYADGRLDREELDARQAGVQGARTLGDLLPPLEGLVLVDPWAAPGAPGTGLMTPDQAHRKAVERWESERRQAFATFLTPTLVCWVIWSMTMLGGFPWPVFVTIGTGMHLFNVLLHKQAIIARETRSIEKKQRKELEKRRDQPGELE